MAQLFFRGTTLSCGERLRLLTFLVGDGYEEGAIRTVLAPRLRTAKSAHHAETVLKDLASARYDRRWFYFNVTQQDFLYLDGTPHGEPRGSQLFTRRVNAWDKHSAKRTASLKEQAEFLGV
jgi:hypothetical protein